MKNSTETRAHRRVHLLVGNDFHCALLGSMGFSTKFIEAQTGLSVSQIGYRLRRASIKRSDYRNGESALSNTVLNQARFVAIPAVEQHLRAVVGEFGRAEPRVVKASARVQTTFRTELAS